MLLAEVQEFEPLPEHVLSSHVLLAPPAQRLLPVPLQVLLCAQVLVSPAAQELDPGVSQFSISHDLSEDGGLHPVESSPWQPMGS